MLSQDFNHFTLEFLKWTLPSLNLDTSRGLSQNQIRVANSVDPDKMAHYHLDLYCLHWYLFQSAGLKVFSFFF